MPSITIRDTQFHYEMAGSGDPPIIFVHGMCSGSWSFEDQIARLSSHFTCVAYDRRGHNRSEAGDEDQSVATHVEDLAALIDALKLDRPVLVGSSAGGGISIELLRRYPGLARGAVLMEPPLLSLDPEAAGRFSAGLMPLLERAVAEGGERAALDVFYGQICGPYWARLDDVRKELTFANAHLLFPTLERLSTDVSADELAALDVPILVIGGSDSPPLPRALNQRLSDLLPDARSIEIEGSAHVVYGEKPAEFAAAVMAFARELATTPSIV